MSDKAIKRCAAALIRRTLFACTSALALGSAVADDLPSLWGAEPATHIAQRLPRPYAVVARPFIGERFGQVDVVTLDPRTLAPISRSPTHLRCERVYAISSGEVLCLSTLLPGKGARFGNPTSYWHSESLELLGSLAYPTKARPSRARMSADGRFSTATVFTSGDSYVAAGLSSFSTSAVIIDRKSNKPVAEDIQNWPVLYKGRLVKSVDLNLWGVTFDPKDSDRFFATAFFDGTPYLAEGRVSKQQINVVKEGVECPSFSPDGSRLAFKRRTGTSSWLPAVITLSNMEETVFDIGESVDDQINWLNRTKLIYEISKRPLIGLPTTDIYVLDVDQKRPQQALWLANAHSPAIVRE